jgi:hypothetical protein
MPTAVASWNDETKGQAPLVSTVADRQLGQPHRARTIRNGKMPTSRGAAAPGSSGIGGGK